MLWIFSFDIFRNCKLYSESHTLETQKYPWIFLLLFLHWRGFQNAWGLIRRFSFVCQHRNYKYFDEYMGKMRISIASFKYISPITFHFRQVKLIKYLFAILCDFFRTSEGYLQFFKIGNESWLTFKNMKHSGETYNVSIWGTRFSTFAIGIWLFIIVLISIASL